MLAPIVVGLGPAKFGRETYFALSAPKKIEELFSSGPQKIVKLRPPEVEAAQKAASRLPMKNVADHVFFQVGNDAYVVSGSGNPSWSFGRGLMSGSKITFQGREGRVISINDPINSLKDSIGIATGNVIGLAALALFGKLVKLDNLKSMLSGGALGGIVITALFALWGATRRVDVGAMGKFGERMPMNEARAIAERNGMDDVFFQSANGDEYVASSRSVMKSDFVSKNRSIITAQR
ncbi:MAG: hypothetical protein HY692_04090 [Cyanobacteria bacterium NC_groundwater_1444_Ag_S-0.65um_54_12]|nr:hypothetical protein [Cyanobacteria bacterium NC_groundwater_1444_Ag_S-0.65um_54_12]